MTITEMLQQSGILTVLGMAVVFSFLCVLVFSVNLMSKIIRKFGWDNDIEAQKNEPSGKKDKTVPREVVAAVTAAIAEYRKE